MKKQLATFLTALGLSLASAHAEPLTLAVFDFLSPEEGLREMGPKISALVGAVSSRILKVSQTHDD